MIIEVASTYAAQQELINPSGPLYTLRTKEKESYLVSAIILQASYSSNKLLTSVKIGRRENKNFYIFMHFNLFFILRLGARARANFAATRASVRWCELPLKVDDVS